LPGISTAIKIRCGPGYTAGRAPDSFQANREAVGTCSRVDAIEGKLTADEEDEERDDGVEELLAEGHLSVGGLDFGQEVEEGTDQMQQPEPPPAMLPGFSYSDLRLFVWHKHGHKTPGRSRRVTRLPAEATA